MWLYVVESGIKVGESGEFEPQNEVIGHKCLKANTVIQSMKKAD